MIIRDNTKAPPTTIIVTENKENLTDEKSYLGLMGAQFRKFQSKSKYWGARNVNSLMYN